MNQALIRHLSELWAERAEIKKMYTHIAILYTFSRVGTLLFDSITLAGAIWFVRYRAFNDAFLQGRNKVELAEMRSMYQPHTLHELWGRERICT